MASLIGILQKANNDRLRELATVWGIRPTDGDNRLLIRAIVTRMLDPWFMRCRVEDLGKTERSVLDLLSQTFGNWMTLSELVQRGRRDGYEAALAAENLKNLGLVFVEPWPEFQKGVSPLRRQLRYPEPDRNDLVIGLPTELVPDITAISAAINDGDGSQVSLRLYLQMRNPRDLQALASRWSIPRPHSLSKGRLIDSLLDVMANSQDAWATAKWNRSQTAKVLARVQEKGGKMAVAELRKEFDEEELHLAWEELNAAMFLEETYVNGRRFLFVPLEIRAALGIQEVRVKRSLAIVQPAGEPTDSQLAFVEDLNTLINFAGTSRVELTTAGYIPQKALARLASLLHSKPDADGRHPQLSFLVDSGSRLGLIKATGGRLVLGDGVDKWVGLGTAEQVKMVLNNWLGAPRFELSIGLDYLSPRISWPTARTRVLKLLAAYCKVGEWYTAQDFAAFAAGVDPDLLASANLRSEISRLSFLSHIDLNRAAASFVANVIAFPLYWFGLVSLARMSAAADAVLCFGLTPMGAWALDVPGGVAPPEASEKPLIVQPNFEVLSISAGGTVLHQLFRFADLRGSDKVRIYTLTKDSILRGVDSGLPADDIVDFLQQHSQKEIPQNVVYTIRDWARQYAPLSLSTATLMEVEAEHILSELLASKKFSAYFSRRLSPNAAVLSPHADLRKLSNELRKRGYSPHLLDEQGARTRQQ